MSISGTPSQAYSNAVLASATAEANTEINSNSSSLSTVETVTANASQSTAARQVTEAATSGQNLAPQAAIVASDKRKRKADVPSEIFRDQSTEQMRGAKRPYFPALTQKTEILSIPLRPVLMPWELSVPELRPGALISINDDDRRAAVFDRLPGSVRKILDQGGMFSDDGLRPNIGESIDLLLELYGSVKNNASDRALLQCYLRYRHELDGVTPIHFACNNVSTLRVMMNIFDDNLDLLRNAILTCADGKGITPLYHVVKNQCLPLVIDLFQDKLDALRHAMLQRGDAEHPFHSSHSDAVGENAELGHDIRALHEALIAMGGYHQEDVVSYAPINCLNMSKATIIAMIELFRDDSDTLIQLCDSLLMTKDFRGVSLFDVFGINKMLELAPRLPYAIDDKGRTILHLLTGEGRKADLAFMLKKREEALSVKL